VLSRLKEKSELILVTLRNNKETLFRELNSFGLTAFFSEILVGSPLLKNKLVLIEKYFKADSRKNTYIIVGDSEVDIYTGKEIGIFTVAATYGIRSREFLIEIKPDACIDRLSGIFDILQKKEFDNNS
jgi:phosphoglycolate phosphatase-like HAD superfamily hydrolase